MKLSIPFEQSTVPPPGAPPQAASRIVAYGNPDKPGVGPVLQELARWAARNQAALCVAREIAPFLDDPAAPATAPFSVYEHNDQNGALFDALHGNLLVSLGGDGTLIRAVRRFWPLKAPVLSVNLGSLGFNASVEPQRLGEALDAWMRGAAPVSERMTVQLRWMRDGRTMAETMAMNDVVLLKEYDSRMIHFTLSQGGQALSSFAADGLILSTPTGATAYNLSAGGPIVYPTMRLLIATAICPHTLTSRPMILPPDPPVVMEFQMRHPRDKGLLWIDGQERWPVAAGDCIAVEADPLPLRLIASAASHYFATLRRKLCWSGEPNPRPAAVPPRSGPDPQAEDLK